MTSPVFTSRCTQKRIRSFSLKKRMIVAACTSLLFSIVGFASMAEAIAVDTESGNDDLLFTGTSLDKGTVSELIHHFRLPSVYVISEISSIFTDQRCGEVPRA